MRRLELLLTAAVVGVSLATPVDAQQITPTGPLAVLPGSTDFYSLTIANLSEDQSIWLDSVTIDPVSVPGEGTMTVALSLPNVLPEPPSGFLPLPGLTVAPGGTLVVDRALELMVPETAVVGTVGARELEFQFGQFTPPFTFLGSVPVAVGLTTQVVPEPSTLTLAGLAAVGLVGYAAWHHRRRAA